MKAAKTAKTAEKLVSERVATANARLNAAAPDLLEALRLFVVAHDIRMAQTGGLCNGHDARAVHAARAAIAKATDA